MVILNDYIPFDKKKLEIILLSVLKNEELMDVHNEKTKEILKKVLNNCVEEIKDNFSKNHFYYMNIHDKFCTHVFKNGKREGYMCCAKIEINSNAWLCSRHDKDYTPRHRVYYKHKPRCLHIRKNNKQCKHMSIKNMSYCYIHEKNYRNNNVEIKLKNMEKLKRLRKKFFKNKYKSKTKYNLTFKLLHILNNNILNKDKLKIKNCIKNIIDIDEYNIYKVTSPLYDKGIT